jgi:hypothetical protein
MRIVIMKQINYGLHETIEGSHRTLSDAVEMYAIYYSDWTVALQELSEYYASDEWQNSGYGDDLPRHREILQKRNAALREIHEIGKELRSVGLDVDLADWAHVDDYYEDAA